MYCEQRNYPLGYKLLCYANQRQPLLNYTLQFPAAAVDVSSCCAGETQCKPPSSKRRASSLPKGAWGEFSSCAALHSGVILKGRRLQCSPSACRRVLPIQALITLQTINAGSWLGGAPAARGRLALGDVKGFSRFILISLEFCCCGELEQSSDEVKMLIFLNTASHFFCFHTTLHSE